jgi:5-methylcytosine-specific restriction endonuclease McrA
MERCIVLNGDFSFLNTIDWKRAVCLVVSGKTEVLKYSNTVLHTVNGAIMNIPLVIRLMKVIRNIYKSHVPFTKKNVMVRDQYQCMYCGDKNDLTIDHIIPTSRGGKNTFENCTTACKPCNNKKGNRIPSEAKMYLHKQPNSPTISEFFRMKMKQMGLDKFLVELGVY